MLFLNYSRNYYQVLKWSCKYENDLEGQDPNHNMTLDLEVYRKFILSFLRRTGLQLSSGKYP